MHRCEWLWRSRANEGARWWPNAIGSVPQPWQPAEPADDGRRRKFCALPYRQHYASEWEQEGREKSSWDEQTVAW
jgi:hypothetical protein